mmetsp:Transcript_20619/g.66141  ORF Transcript_20619/g.66141 Transcript_20619/m.66141 type:complete len:250 (-) Transcript_20619:1887-2636(-)
MIWRRGASWAITVSRPPSKASRSSWSGDCTRISSTAACVDARRRRIWSARASWRVRAWRPSFRPCSGVCSTRWSPTRSSTGWSAGRRGMTWWIVASPLARTRAMHWLASVATWKLVCASVPWQRHSRTALRLERCRPASPRCSSPRRSPRLPRQVVALAAPISLVARPRRPRRWPPSCCATARWWHCAQLRSWSSVGTLMRTPRAHSRTASWTRTRWFSPLWRCTNRTRTRASCWTPCSVLLAAPRERA